MSVNGPELLRLFQQHHAYVWRYLRYLGAAPELADDLTQETFMKLLEGARFEHRSDGETARFLTTVARNLYFGSLRRARTVHEQSLAELEDADAVWHAVYDTAGGEDPRLDALRSCIDQLTGTAREALTLYYEQQLSGPEIAARLDRSDDYVRTLLYRTRHTLRDCVQRKTTRR